MAKDMRLKQLVAKTASLYEDDFKNEEGAIDKDALTSFVLSELEEREAVGAALEEEGARFFVWEVIREKYRKTHKDMKTQVEEAMAEMLQPRLPSFEEVRRITISVPSGASSHDTKNLLDCALWEVEAAEDDYGKRAASMLEHQRYLQALATHMQRKGFSESDKVSKLYGVA